MESRFSSEMVGTGSLIMGFHFQIVGNHAVWNVGLRIFWEVGFHVLNECVFLYADLVRPRSGYLSLLMAFHELFLTGLGWIKGRIIWPSPWVWARGSVNGPSHGPTPWARERGSVDGIGRWSSLGLIDNKWGKLGFRAHSPMSGNMSQHIFIIKIISKQDTKMIFKKTELKILFRKQNTNYILIFNFIIFI